MKTKKQIDNEAIFKNEKYIENKDLFVKKAQRTAINKYYFKNQFKKDIFLILLSAFLTVIAFDYFISSTGQHGIYPGGLGSISRFLAVVISPGNDPHAIQMQSTFYYVWYVGLNIPFMIFGFWKLGFRFSFTTILYMLLQISIDQILQVIPVINPQEFHMIVNYPLIAQISDQWNAFISLFIFAVIGGFLMGIAYSRVYKADSSTGGTDFLTFYFSIKKNKNVGSINRNLNFAILAIVIIINTIIMNTNDIPSSVKVNVLSNANGNEINNMVTWVFDYGKDFKQNGIKLSWFQEFNQLLTNQGLDHDKKELVKHFSDHSKDYNEAWTFFISHLANQSDFEYSSRMNAIMRFEYIFGPSLFSSIIFLITQALVINAAYPKYKVRTYMITSTKTEELKTTLVENGYKNNIIINDSQVTSADDLVDKNKKVMIISMTVMNWRNIKKFLHEVDVDMTVNVLRTKGVEGKFDYEIRNDHVQQYVHNEILNSKKAMKKIEKLAFEKTKKDMLQDETNN